MPRYFFDPEIVIGIARGEIGYREKKSNKDLDDKTANAGDKNYTKYARDLDAIPDFYNGKKQGICGWCDIFVDDCFVKAYGVEEGRMLLCQPLRSCGAGPYYSAQYFKAKKQYHTSDPQPGDQIFFYPSDGSGKISHTGLVSAVDAQYVYTIEGNTSANGISGVVAEKKYQKNNKRIAGYGRPDWGELPDDEPDEDTGEDTPDMPPEQDADVMLYNGPGDEHGTAGTYGKALEVVGMTWDGWIAVRLSERVLWCRAEDVILTARPAGDGETDD